MSGTSARRKTAARSSDHDADEGVGDPQRLRARARPARVLAVEEGGAGQGAEDPADAVHGLGQVDARRRVAGIAEDGRVGVRDRLEEGEPAAITHTPSRNAQKDAIAGGGDEPEAPDRHHQQAGDDAPLVAELRGQPTGGQRHQEVAEVVRELDPGRLRQGQLQLGLEVLVHHVDHPVAEAPQQEQRADESERGHHVPAVRRDEHALLLCAHDVPPPNCRIAARDGRRRMACL